MKCNKSELIKAGVREGFRNGISKYATRRCYGYDITNDGYLVVNPNEAMTVQWIFQRYIHGDSLGGNCILLGEAGDSFTNWQAKME